MAARTGGDLDTERLNLGLISRLMTESPAGVPDLVSLDFLPHSIQIAVSVVWAHLSATSISLGPWAYLRSRLINVEYSSHLVPGKRTVPRRILHHNLQISCQTGNGKSEGSKTEMDSI